MSFAMVSILVTEGQRCAICIPCLTIFFYMVNLVTMSAIVKDDYMEERKKLLQDEKILFTGGDVHLTETEEKVNKYLLELKKFELGESYNNLSKFLPAKNFLLAKKEIEQSKVFQFIKRIPKGALLHTHMLAGVSTDYVIYNFTYMDNVYACCNGHNIFKLKVLEHPGQDTNCSWTSLKTYREKNKNFDTFLKEKLTLNVNDIKKSREDIWSKFKNTFSTLYDLVAYRPVFKKYIAQLLKELYEDNVMYTELRGTFMPLYDRNGTTYGIDEFLESLIKAVIDFKETHPDFLGVKYIHSIYRGVDSTTLEKCLKELIRYQVKYPNFIAGFDFVGLEEEGKNIVDFHNVLRKYSKNLKFFFHAGETNQFGHTDLNMADAILLNSSRIGHGFALAKHPKMLELARQRDIAIELSPISNQVLKLNADPRNHPATVLLSKGHPVVICNDDPSAWEATGLSYDWYVVFMSMTWEDDGLKVLKKFAQDSIKYSALDEKEKESALKAWQAQWAKFMEDMVDNIRNK